MIAMDQEDETLTTRRESRLHAAVRHHFAAGEAARRSRFRMSQDVRSPQNMPSHHVRWHFAIGCSDGRMGVVYDSPGDWLTQCASRSDSRA